jgi:uncharacterized membrane protein YfcA
MALIGLLLAALVGLSLGLLGGGGSIVTVPIFVYVLGFDPKQAIGMSLAVVGVTSLVGAARHWRVGNLDLRVALLFGGVAMAGSLLGSRLAAFVSGATQLAFFAVVMLLAAIFMFRDRAPVAAVDRAGGRRQLALLAAAGLATGALTGLVGVGGGFLIVPALVLLAGVPMKRAVGTSLLVIAMNAGAGFVGYLGQVDMRWGAMAAFTAVAVVGILAGASLVRYVSPRLLKRSFAAFLVVMGLFILIQSRAVLLG